MFAFYFFTVEVLRKTWKSLNDTLVRKSKALPSGASADDIEAAWIWMKYMSWLIPYRSRKG